MTDLAVCDAFDLPTIITRCIVKIRNFDDEETLQKNIRDYVITDTVAGERLIDIHHLPHKVRFYLRRVLGT